jgi:hypothetical protein
MYIHGDSDVRQTEIHTALVPEPSAFEFEMVVEKLDTYHQSLIKSQQKLLQQGV